MRRPPPRSLRKIADSKLRSLRQPRGFQAYGNALYNSVSNQAQACALNPESCKRFKNAELAATAAQTAGGTNTDALFYYDESIPMAPHTANGHKAGNPCSRPY
jgi:hypothetical protein